MHYSSDNNRNDVRGNIICVIALWAQDKLAFG